MNNKRFEVLFYGDVINCVRDENGKEYNLQELISILMKQQATITELEKEVNLLRPTNLEQYEQIQKLQKENEQLRENLHNCRLNKNIISEKLKLWQDVHKEYNIYSIKDFEELMKNDK